MKARGLVLLMSALVITGCGQEALYSNLEEREANEMLAILLSNGIDARKVAVGEALQVRTSQRELPNAIALLSEHGYPREKFQSLGDVFEREGFVSSPTEERARLLYALSQELSKTISTIDGVITARVHLAIPERHALSEKVSPSSASIFIKYRPGAAVAEQSASVKALVVNSIEGLPYDNVTVTFFPASRASRTDVTRRAHDVRLAGIAVDTWQLLLGGAILLLALIALARRATPRATKKR